MPLLITIRLGRSMCFLSAGILNYSFPVNPYTRETDRLQIRLAINCYIADEQNEHKYIIAMTGKRKKSSISRKEFLKRSSAGVIGAGLLVNHPLEWVKSTNSPGKYLLGNTGINVTSMGFGASRTQEPALLLAALDAGINFIDTGRSYANGQNEIMVGKVIKELRKDLVIQSKVKIQLDEKGEALKSKEVSRKIYDLMQKALNDSMIALQTDYLDIWIIHGAESEEIIHHETVIGFFDEAKKKGMIRAHGFSSHQNQIKLLSAQNERNFYDVVMVPYTFSGSYIHSNTGHHSEYNQTELEAEVVKASKNSTGIIAMKTCSGGPYADENDGEKTFGKAIKWVVDKPYIHTAAVAMANFNQITENTKFVFNNQ